MSIILSDWSTQCFVYSLDEIAACSGKPLQNYIRAEYNKPESRMLKVDDKKREVIRLSWCGGIGELEHASVIPERIGLMPESDIAYGTAVPIYVQKHALMRLQERLGILPGLLHHQIFELFEEENITFHCRGEASLVEFKLSDKKLGYLYCSMSEGVVVIRSFLFLTNDGTPEGKRLSEMTRLQRLDKSFLSIDTLAGFRSFKISEDAALSELFIEAGCGDLLDLSDIETFCLAEVKEKDLLMLLNYMMRAGTHPPIKAANA